MGTKQMRKIVFMNNKGGVGKTASISAIGHILSTFGKKVLLVDMDPQANTSQLFGFTENDTEYSLKDMLQGKVYLVSNTVEDILLDANKDIRECIYKTDYENLYLIPSYITLSNVENQLLGNVTLPQQFRLKNQLEKIEEDYDFCLIDCGPSVSLLNVNALAASQEVFIPSKSDKDSRVGIANVIRLMNTVQGYNQELKLKGVFLTQFDERKKICREAKADCKAALGKHFLEELSIPNNTKVEQTGANQRPLYELDRYGKATQKYMELAQWILKH